VESIIRPWLSIVTFHPLLRVQPWPQAPVGTLQLMSSTWPLIEYAPIAQPPSSTSTSPFAPTVTASPTAQSTAPAHKSASSEAWIAGPVLGTVALIAFISIAIWYLRNRQRERSAWQEEQKRVSGIVGSGSSRSELPWSPRFRWGELISSHIYRNQLIWRFFCEALASLLKILRHRTKLAFHHF
jgi:hypothetical protein